VAFTAEQQDALVRFYGKMGTSACDTRARLGAVARDGGHVPYLVADEDRQRLVHVSRNVIDLRKALSSAVAATERASQWLGQSTALHCAGGGAELSLMATVNESVFVNVRLFGVNLDSCSMAEAAECVTLMIGIRATMNVTAMSERIGEALLGDGVRARLDATMSTNAGATITAAMPPPAPSAVPSARVWRQFGARDVTRGEILTDRNERVVARAASGDVVLKAMFIGSRAERDPGEARHELRMHELLSRRASQYVVPLMTHFEARLRLPGRSSVRKSIVLVMPAAEMIDISSVREPREMAQCGGELLAAVAALHERHVLHNDVNWSNTLRVGASRRVVLCDFEYSVVVDVEGSAPMRRGIGTAGYMAPEVIRGVAASVTTAADVFSAGASLRELVAHDICARLRALVRRMCAKQPQQRPSAAAALEAWQRDVAPALLRLEVGPR
jgi:hypothetical protein